MAQTPVSNWTGTLCYQHVAFITLPISNGSGDATLPMDMMRFQSSASMNTKDLFKLEDEYLASYDRYKKQEEKNAEDKEARQEKMDIAIAVSKEERAERKKKEEERKQKEIDEQNDKIKHLQEVCSIDADTARKKLLEGNWDVEQAASAYWQQPAMQPQSNNVNLIFQMERDSQVSHVFRETATVFELYQVAYSLVPDQNRGFKMRAQGGGGLNITLGESEFSFPIKSLGMVAGETYHIFINYR